MALECESKRGLHGGRKAKSAENRAKELAVQAMLVDKQIHSRHPVTVLHCPGSNVILVDTLSLDAVDDTGKHPVKLVSMLAACPRQECQLVHGAER